MTRSWITRFVVLLPLFAFRPGQIQARWSEPSTRALIDEGRLLESRGRLDSARSLYERALALDPTGEEGPCRLARLSLYLKDYDRAYELLRRIRGSHPRSALGLAVTALYQFCLRQSDRALETVRRALEIDPNLKEGYLIQADILFALRDMDRASKVLDEMLRRHPSDPEGLYLKGIITFYNRDLEKAQAFLEASARINPHAFNVQKDLVQIYSLNGNPARALQILEGLLLQKPDDASLQTLQTGLSQRLDLAKQGERRRVGALDLLYDRRIAPGALDRIIETLTTAHETLTAGRRIKPEEVRVVILNRTDQLLPAYYNHVSNEITISREYFENLQTKDQRELGKHLIFHEYSHLVFYHEMKTPLPPAALWVIEGLAEYEAGGYSYVPVDFEDTFREGLFDLESLEEYLPVSAVGIGTNREVAYIQSYAMVACLMNHYGEEKGMSVLKRLASAYTRFGPDHESVVREILGMSQSDLLDWVARYIDTRWIVQSQGVSTRGFAE